MHGALDYRVRSLRIHNVQQDVDYFIAPGPKNRGTQDLFGFRVNGDLDETLRLALLNCPAYSAHRMGRGEGRSPRLPYLGVREAASTQRRIYVQSVGLDTVGHAAMVCAEEVVGNDFIVVVRGMCKGATAVAVAQRPDAGHSGLQLIVNADVAAFVRCDPGVFEAQIVRVGNTSHRQKNMRAQ